jgi:haloalkane dehalogenase
MDIRTETFGGAFPWTSKYVDVGGHKIAYVDQGGGEPIVMLHGNPTWGFLYRKFIGPLSQAHRAIAVDHLGFGRSDKPLDGDYTLAGHISRLAQVMEQLDLRDVTLVMQDWGGPIGLGWAVDHPERVKRLAILNTWAFRIPAGSRINPLLELFRQPAIGEAIVQGLNLFVEGFLPAGIWRKDVLDEVMPAYRAPFPDWNSRIATLKFPRDIPVGEDHPSTSAMGHIQDNLGTLNVPTFIIWAMQDPAFPAQLLDVWKTVFPHAEAHAIDQASHFLQEDAPGEIVAHIHALMAK